jgi:hypothetical protein
MKSEQKTVITPAKEAKLVEKEEIVIKQVHDNDKFIIERKINSEEEVTKEVLGSIFQQITEAVDNLETQKLEIPKQVEVKLAQINKELEALKKRKAAFEPTIKKFGLEKPKEAKVPGIKAV